MRRMRVAVLLLAAALVGAGCGGTGNDLVVSADPSLKDAFTSYGADFEEADATFSIARSDELAKRIRDGATMDVFASSDLKLLKALNTEGLIGRPTLFASDQFQVALRSERVARKVMTLRDLGKRGLRVAIASESSRAGAATRTLLDRLPPSRRKAILANVRAREPDGAGVVDKLASGAVDAGFVFESESRAATTDGKIGGFALPQAGRGMIVEYAVAVVKAARRPAAAKAFVFGLLSGAGSEAVQRAGFQGGVRPRCGSHSASRARCPADQRISPAPLEF